MLDDSEAQRQPQLGVALASRYSCCFPRERCHQLRGEFEPEVGTEGSLLFIGNSQVSKLDERISGVWRLDGHGHDDDVTEVMMLDITESGHIFGKNVVTKAVEPNRFQITGRLSGEDDSSCKVLLHQHSTADGDSRGPCVRTF